jgi:subtilisin family serine protease
MLDFNDDGIGTTTLFDVLIGWHNNKPINPFTGYKRPTVLNMSFISARSFYGVGNALPTAGNYRGTPWTTFTYAYAAANYAMSRAQSTYPVLVDSRKIDVEECISAGICCVSAAGNFGSIMDRIGGPDYNNYLVSGGTTYYYNRGSGNQAANGVICVGNSISADTAPITTPSETIYYNSHCGPLVDIFANGVQIAMATSNTGIYADSSPYTYPNSGFKMTFMTGTSFSSPAVAGIAAQFLQVYPTATPLQIKQKIIEVSTPDALFDNPGSLAYGNTKYLFGASNKIAYQPFNNYENFKIQGSTSITNVAMK